ncbi:hypothetical protein INR49_026276 [Caranx melampygus]|nr:hypothetical protein INR49_026276 [Caranx melampygus]
MSAQTVGMRLGMGFFCFFFLSPYTAAGSVWTTKQGCSSFPGSPQLPVGAVDRCQARTNEERALPDAVASVRAVSAHSNLCRK